MALSPQQAHVASLIYTLARQRGLPDARARELIAASYAESGLNPSIRNRSSGATGLFQLLSSGYVNRANQLGGVTNPRANTLAILGDYANYWRSHPGAPPGAAAAAVERSGEGSGFYSGPLRLLAGFRPGNIAPGAPAVPAVPGASTLRAPAPVDLQPYRQAALTALFQQTGAKTPDYSQFFGAIKSLRQAQTTQPTAQPATTASPTASTPVAPATGKLVRFTGASLDGVRPGFLRQVSAASRAAGATVIKVTSGYRSPAHNAAVGGVPHSNHMSGDAIDAYGYVPGRGWVPLGVLLKEVAGHFGLRSGDQAGFYHGGADLVHVDDGANQR